MPERSPYKMAIWGGSCVSFVLLTVALAMINGVDSPRLLYLWLLFAICSSPFLIMDAINGKYAILWIMMAVYFVLYGAADFLALLAGTASSSSGVLELAEFAILIAAVMLVLGYIVMARRGSAATMSAVHQEWAPAATLIVGLVLWAVGIAATLYWQIGLQARSFRLEYVSPLTGMAVTLGRMMQPLGTALIAYRTVKSGSKLLLLVMMILLMIEFVVGFISDSKELSIRGMIILLATRFLLQGRIPKLWLMLGALVAVLSFPVFQAYRHEVLGVRGQAREQAARNLTENLSIAIRSITEPSAYGSQAGPGFIGRVSLKGNMQLILERVGDTAKYQAGYTYLLFLEGFVPRLLWEDKPDTSVGQLFNRELNISAFRDVYISPSYLGEFYWNFGWTGVVAGMFLLGCLLGMIGRRVALAQSATVTRYLVLLLTIYTFCMRFEGGIALEALVWVRSLLAVAVLHWVFARQPNDADGVETTVMFEDSQMAGGRKEFGNLMS